MAVYERRYKRYEGTMTSQRGRFWVIPRYAIKDVFRSKLFVAFFVLALLPPLIAAVIIYVLHNASFLAFFPDLQVDQILAVDGSFFKKLMNIQMWPAFLTALLIGPGLVSKDLANNSLPLYLSRPFSRAQYVLGKITILAFLLSCLTWISGLAVFLLQGNFEGIGWVLDHLNIAIGVFVGSWLWIVTVSLLALALSAWVKWRPVAAFTMLVILLSGLFFGFVINFLFKTQWGSMVSMISSMESVFHWLLGLPSEGGLPPSLGCLSLLGFSALSLLLLHLKLRAYEVVS
jgi:ABC-2 type transport system permease protein